MKMMNCVDLQLATEYRYSRKQIRKYILEDIQSCDELMLKVSDSIGLIMKWLMADHGYLSKNARLLRLQLAHPNIEDLVVDLLSVTLLAETPDKFTQVVGQCAGYIPLQDKREQLQTVAEILAILCQQDFFDLVRNEFNELMVVTNYCLDDKIKTLLNQVKYLPPMVCAPRELTKNYQSGYLTFDDSLILKDNFHNDDICLDSLNTFNSVPLSLKVEMLTKISEPVGKAIDTPEKLQAWQRMVTDSYQVYLDLIAAGNEFYLTHKVDKRGRTYAQGYHVSYQGNKFRQAIIELAEKRVLTK